MSVSCIVAYHLGTRGIGKNNKMVWNVPEDMGFFSSTTRTVTVLHKTPSMRNAVIMGRNTWESMGSKPLPGRLNIILTRQPNYTVQNTNQDVLVYSDFLPALRYCWDNPDKIAEIFVCGGEELYKQATQSLLCTKVYANFIFNKDLANIDNNMNTDNIDDAENITSVNKQFDKFMPEFEDFFPYRILGDVFTSKTPGFSYSFNLYSRYPISETLSTDYQPLPENIDVEYNALVNRVMNYGKFKSDRTNIGTISRHGEMMRIDLKQGFPLLTSKKIFTKGIVEELLWFISGNTDSKVLAAQGVKIWNENGCKKNLDTLGFTEREEGDLGPVYGFQWRHYGATYEKCDTDYTGKGIDQLSNVINRLKTYPKCRRVMMTAWNPKDIPLMVLPPCHSDSQFLVDDDGNLTCIMKQRSCDIACGLPWNISSYALLTHLIASVTGLKASELVIQLGDTHIYKDHINNLTRQVKRKILAPPQLVLNKKESLFDYKAEDIKIIGYNAHPTVYYEMHV